MFMTKGDKIRNRMICLFQKCVTGFTIVSQKEIWLKTWRKGGYR